jgi:hypothetical protein
LLATYLLVSILVIGGILAGAITFLDSQTKDESTSITITEYLESTSEGEYQITSEVSNGDGVNIKESDNSSIKINGIWEKQIITIRFNATDGLKNEDEIMKVAYQSVNGYESVQSGYNHTGWHLAFHSISDKVGRSPMHLIVDNGNYNTTSDILMSFSNEVPAGRPKLAEATITIDTDTRISSARATIYYSDSHYEEGILMPVLLHELGHTLGLGHSTSEYSIMYPKVVVVNDSTIGEIGTCEIAAVNKMYFTDEKLKEITC